MWMKTSNRYSGRPAASTRTRLSGAALSGLASALPAEPPPTMTKSFRDALIAPPVTLSSSPDTQRQLVRKAGPHRSHGRECLLKVGPCQRVERLGVDVAGRRSPPSLARSRGRRLEPAMSHRCNWDMVRRLFSLVLVLVVAGRGGR